MKIYLILFHFFFIKLYSQQTLDISVVNKKIDSVMKAKALFLPNKRYFKEVKCFDYNFLNGISKNKGQNRFSIFYNNKNEIEKIDNVGLLVNKTILNLSYYPIKISKDYLIYIIEVYNTKNKIRRIIRGFILFNKAENQLYHIAYENSVENGLKGKVYLEGLAQLDSRLYIRKIVKIHSGTNIIQENGFLLYDDDNFITFVLNEGKINRKFDNNLSNLSKLFNYNKDLKNYKLAHLSANTKTPYFHPYFIYGFSLFDYEKYD